MDVNRTLTEYNELLKAIDDKKKEIIRKTTREEHLEEENERKFQETIQSSLEILQIEGKENEMSAREAAVRGTIAQVDNSMKMQSQKVENHFKRLVKTLGLKVTMTAVGENEDQPRAELRIQFRDIPDHFIRLIYDTISEDYALEEVQPEHSNFYQLQQFLRDTKDIQGLLSSYRAKYLHAQS